MDSNEATGTPAKNTRVIVCVPHSYTINKTFEYEVKKLLATAGSNRGLVLNPRCKRHPRQQILFDLRCGI